MAAVGIVSAIVAMAVTRAEAQSASSSPGYSDDAARMAVLLDRSARMVLSVDPMTVDGIDLARDLNEMAAQLDPDNAENWRSLIITARIAEDLELVESATSELLRLQPGNETGQLLRLRQAVDRIQTADGRISFYERLLEPGTRASLPSSVSAALAFDLAQLYQRRGNMGAFSKWLAEAIAIDPSYAPAMSMAAGYFQANVDDPVAQAELLLSLMMSRLNDPSVPITLGGHFLEHGAVAGAARLYQFGALGSNVQNNMTSQELVADLAMAQWGSGAGEAGLETIAQRQQMANSMYRAALLRRDPDMSRRDVAGISAPLGETLALTRAVITADIDPEILGAALADLTESYDAARMRIDAELLTASEEEAPALRQRQVTNDLQVVAILLWLGGDVAEARRYYDRAVAAFMMPDVSRQLYEGLFAMRAGELDQATVLLEPLAEDDDRALAALAMTQLAAGEQRGAARNLLKVWTAQPGSLLGLWSHRQLERLLDRSIPVGETAQRLEALLEAVPRSIDRYPTDPRAALSMRVVSVDSDIAPFEPVLVNIEITNNSVVTMSISNDGPIQNLVLLIPALQIPRVSLLSPPAVVVPIDRRLSIPPHGSVVIPVDLRRTWVGDLLATHPLDGAMMRVRGMLNFTVSASMAGDDATVYMPGLLGTEYQCSIFRADGVRVTEAWIDDAIGRISDTSVAPDAVAMALLLHAVSRELILLPDDVDQPEGESPAGIPVDMITEAVLSAFPRLSPVGQAWLVGVLPRSATADPVVNMAMKRDDRVLRVALMLRLLMKDPTPELLHDPVLEAAERSGDERLAHMARWVYSRINQTLEARFQEMTGEEVEMDDSNLIVPR